MGGQQRDRHDPFVPRRYRDDGLVWSQSGGIAGAVRSLRAHRWLAGLAGRRWRIMSPRQWKADNDGVRKAVGITEDLSATACRRIMSAGIRRNVFQHDPVRPLNERPRSAVRSTMGSLGGTHCRSVARVARGALPAPLAFAGSDRRRQELYRLGIGHDRPCHLKLDRSAPNHDRSGIVLAKPRR